MGGPSVQPRGRLGHTRRRTRTASLAALVALVCAGAALYSARRPMPLPPASPWPMRRHDARQSSAGDVSGPTSGGLRWTVDLPEACAGEPVTGMGGTLVVPLGASLLAVDGAGAELWRTGGNDAFTPMCPVGTSKGGASAARDGAAVELVTLGPRGEFVSQSVVKDTSTGTLAGWPTPRGWTVVTSYDCEVLMVGSGGRVRQRTELPSARFGLDAAGSGDAVYVLYGSRSDAGLQVARVEWRRGLQWVVALPHPPGWGEVGVPVCRIVAFGDGRICVCSSAGLSWLSADGQVLGTIASGALRATDSPAEEWSQLQLALAADETTYAVCGWNVIAFGPERSERWRAPLPAGTEAMGIAVDRDGRAYVTTRLRPEAEGAAARPQVVCYGPDGSRQWSCASPTGDFVTGPVLGAEGVLYAVTRDADAKRDSLVAIVE